MPKPATTKRRMLLDPSPVDQTVKELGEERIRTVFDRFDHVCVMFSGGKDSSCILNLALAEHRRRKLTKPLDVVFYDEEAIPFETERYVRTVANLPEVSLRWLCLPTRQNNACSPASPYWFPWAPEDEELWCRPAPPEGIFIKDFPKWDFGPIANRLAIPEANALLFDPKEHGSVGLVMGIRADESMTRRRAVLRRKEDNWIVPFVRDAYSHCRWPGCENETARPTSTMCEVHQGRRMPYTDITDLHNISKCYCIYDWKTEDVWTYANDFAEYNHAYDLMEMAGLPHFRQRCAPPYAAEPMQALWTFRVCFPDVWDKMSERVPGANTAARYARTALYSFGGRLSPPEGDFWDERAWKDLIRSLLLKHSEKSRKLTAERIQLLIRRHYQKTTDPILPDIPHPVTGLSWSFLSMVAQRGDPKARKNPEWQIAQRGDPTKIAEARTRYREGLQKWRQMNRESD